jgi:predicted PurR-regulated permease PerM
MEPVNRNEQHFYTAFVLLLVLALSALFLAVIWPFWQALLLGALLAGFCHPLYRWLTRLFRGRTSVAAGVTVLLLFVLIVGPLSAFLGVVVQQALNVSEQALPWVQQHFGATSTFDIHTWLAQRFPTVAEFVPSQEQIVESVGTAAKAAGGFLVASASHMTAGTAVVLLNLFITLYAMFFFLKEGGTILAQLLYYLPLRDEEETQMVQRFVSITRATVKGTLVIGVLQGALAGLGFWVAGIGGAVFWGTLMMVLSIVPGIGAALVWVPAVLYLLATSQVWVGAALGLWCAVVVGTIDNVLRSTLVGRDAKMPDLLILVGTLGGLYLFGPIGFMVGPIVCGVFLTAWSIYGTVFKDVLPPVKTAPDPPGEERHRKTSGEI